MAERRLQITVDGVNRSGSKVLKEVNGDLGGLKGEAGFAKEAMIGLAEGIDGGLGSLVSLAAGAATGAGAIALLSEGFKVAVEFIREATKEAAEAARIDAQVATVLRSTGMAAGMTARQIDELAGELENTSGVERDLIKRNEGVMLTFTNVSRSVFPEAIAAALNLSAVMGQDLQSSIVQIGKALNEPVQGVSALRRVGVQLSDQQEQQVAQYMALGDVESAQKIILQELQKEFGGAAEAMHVAGDASDTLANSMTHFNEAAGKKMLPNQIAWNTAMATMIDLLNYAVFGEETYTNALKEHTDGLQTGTLAWQETTTATETNTIATDSNKFALDSSIFAVRGVSSANEQAAGSIDGFTGAMVDSEKEVQEWIKANNKAAEEQRAAWRQVILVQEDYARSLDRTSLAADGMFANINTGIDNMIANYKDQIKFAELGGDDLTQAFKDVQTAVETGLITPEQGQTMLDDLYIKSQQIQIEMGKIDASTAAQNISDTLGISIEDAAKELQKIVDMDGKHISIFLDVYHTDWNSGSAGGPKDSPTYTPSTWNNPSSGNSDNSGSGGDTGPGNQQETKTPIQLNQIFNGTTDPRQAAREGFGAINRAKSVGLI